MNVPADDDWLTLEVLFFSAGLRSLVVSADHKHNPAVRPVGLPDIEQIGLDNDVELKPGDRVVDFARFDRLSSDARSIYWLGIYCHAVDSVGDRSNFLGVGVWFNGDRTLRHQLVLESLSATLDDLSGLHLGDLQRRSTDLVANLQKFRQELGRTGGIPIRSSQFGLADVETADVSRAYVRVSRTDAEYVQLAGAISGLLLPSGNTKQVRPSRILFLLGPNLPETPRRSWVLFNNLVELTGKYSAVDSLLESVLDGQAALRGEIEALRERDRSLLEALDAERTRSAAQERERGDTQRKVGELEKELAQNKQWLMSCEQDRADLQGTIRRLESQLSSFPPTRTGSGGSANGPIVEMSQKQHSAGTHGQQTRDMERAVASIRKFQEQRFAESLQVVNGLSEKIGDLSWIASTTQKLVVIIALTTFVSCLALTYLTYASMTANSSHNPANSPSIRGSPLGVPASTPQPSSPSVRGAGSPEPTDTLR